MPKKLPTRQQPKRTPTLSSGRALGPKSPLTEPKVDLQSFLALCMSNWDDLYSEEEKQQIIKSLPISITGSHERSASLEVSQTAEPNERHSKNTDGLRCPLPPESITTNPYIKRAVARFKRDVSEGYYEKSWQDKAKKAMDERQDGKFDKYLADYVEELHTSEHELLIKDTFAEDSSNSEYENNKPRFKNSTGNDNKRSKPNSKPTGKKINRKIREGSLLRDELALSDTED